MSIYGSLPAPNDDDHLDDCGLWDKHDGCWQRSDRPCTCGQPDAPLVYQGSHVLPSETDKRGGYVDIASIAGFITRDGRDESDLDYDTPWSYLRFGVNGETVILTERNVRQVADTLNEWLALPKVRA